MKYFRCRCDLTVCLLRQKRSGANRYVYHETIKEWMPFERIQMCNNKASVAPEISYEEMVLEML